MATPDLLPDAIREVIAALNEMTGAMAQAGTAATFAFNELGKFTSAVSATVGQFVSAFNPATVQLFSMAVHDANAALGAVLVPTMERFRAIVNQINVVFSSLNPQARLMIASLAGASVGIVVLTGVVQGLAIVINSATAGIPAIIGAIVGAASGIALMSGTMQQFQDTLRQVTSFVRPVLDALGNAFQKVFDAAQPVLAAVLQLTAQFQGQLVGVINQVAQSVAGFVSQLVPMIAQVLPVLLQLSSASQSVVAGFVSLVTAILGPVLSVFAAFAPVVQLLLLPLTTAMKVLGTITTFIGGVLGPVLELVTAPLRLFSDMLGAVANALQDAVNDLSGAFREVAGTFAELMGELMAALKELAAPFKEFLLGVAVGAVRTFTDALKTLAGWVRVVVREIREFFGLQTLGGGPERRTEGSRSVSTQSPEAYAKKLQEAAFGMGISPAQQTAQHTNSMVTLLEQLPEKLAQAIIRAWKEKGQEVRRTANDETGAAVFGGAAWDAVRQQLRAITG